MRCKTANSPENCGQDARSPLCSYVEAWFDCVSRPCSSAQRGGDELDDTAHRPASLKLADDVDRIVTRAEAEVPTGTDQAVAGARLLGTIYGSGEKEVVPAESLWRSPLAH